MAGKDAVTVARSVDGDACGYTFSDTAPERSFAPNAIHVMFSGAPWSTAVLPSRSGDAYESVPTDVAQ